MSPRLNGLTVKKVVNTFDRRNSVGILAAPCPVIEGDCRRRYIGDVPEAEAQWHEQAVAVGFGDVDRQRAAGVDLTGDGTYHTVEIDRLDPVTVEHRVGGWKDADVIRVAGGDDDDGRSGRLKLGHHLLLGSVACGVVRRKHHRVDIVRSCHGARTVRGRG